MLKYLAIAGVAALAVTAAFFYSGEGNDQGPVEYRLGKVERGNLIKTVSASGKLNAVVSVKVGSQISGQISALSADFNSQVKAGQVIAQIDPQSFEAKVREARAELALAKSTVLIREAAVVRAHADLENATATLAAVRADGKAAFVTLADAKLDYDRKRKLTSAAVAASAVDKSRAAYQIAGSRLGATRARIAAQKSSVSAHKAAIDMAVAEVALARAQVQKREAVLNYASIDLERTFIRSPVDGVVIGRDVDMGQTVAASLQAPTMFTIAQDLTKMQVETSVDEADIGQLREGLSAKFTVDSFPDQAFRGIVGQIRKAPLEVSNVITYTVVVNAGNPDYRLLPGMTANVEFLVSEQRDVLKIPNAALRFRPASANAAGRTTAAAAGTATARQGDGSSGPSGGPSGGRGAARMARLAQQLDLNQQQKEQITELQDKLGEQRRALRRQGMGREERRKVTKRLRAQQSKEIMAILSPAQRGKYEKLLARRANRNRTGSQPGAVWVLDEGQPKRVAVRTGVSDGAFTQVNGGDLKPGQEVIVGAKRSRKGSQSDSRRVVRRLGL